MRIIKVKAVGNDNMMDNMIMIWIVNLRHQRGNGLELLGLREVKTLVCCYGITLTLYQCLYINWWGG